MRELVRLEETDARLQVERGRALLKAGEARLRESGVADVTVIHRHGGIVETIPEQESDARVVVIGKRGAGHEFATNHVGSKIERVVRANSKPILIANRAAEAPNSVVFAYDAGPAADRAFERLINSPLFEGLPLHIVMAGSENDTHRSALEAAADQLRAGHAVTTSLRQGKPEQVITDIVEQTSGTMLVMGLMAIRHFAH